MKAALQTMTLATSIQLECKKEGCGYTYESDPPAGTNIHGTEEDVIQHYLAFVDKERKTRLAKRKSTEYRIKRNQLKFQRQREAYEIAEKERKKRGGKAQTVNVDPRRLEKPGV